MRDAHAALVLVLTVLAARPAPGQTQAQFKGEAERRNRKASELYQQGRFEEALRLYQAAYDLYPEPRYLFNLGLAKEKVFDYEGCTLAFEQFLREARDATESVRKQAEERRVSCRERAEILVRFTSAPTNAAIYLGEGEARRLQGRTPLEMRLHPGEYRVSMELSGYVPHRETITVEPGKKPQVDFVLDKLSSIRIEADPAGARVKIDDGDWESAPVTREVRPGAHQVKVLKEGYQPESREVRVEPGREVSVLFALRPLPRIRTLAVRTSEAVPGASVRIDGRPSGAPPLRTELSPGSHRLEITAPGRIPFAQDVTVPEDRDLKLLVTLERRRSRRDRLITWSLGGASGLALLVGGIYGGLAFRDQSAFEDHPTPALKDRGEERAEKADVSFATALVLGGGAVLWHLLTEPDTSRARLDY